MRRAFALVLALAAAPALAADAPELPKPPTTPLPKFPNPLHDAEIGETCFYKVREPGTDDGWARYFEERVLARHEVKGKLRVLVETLETNADRSKYFNPLADASRWRDADAEFELPEGARWLKDKEKDEVVYLGGTPPTVAVRATKRVLELAPPRERPDGPRTQLQFWFSHDVPVLGRAKQFPSVRGGERIALAWDKRLPAEECARRAEAYPDEAEKEAAAPPKPEPAMGDAPAPDAPPMGDAPAPEGGMDDAPGMG